MTPAPVRTEVIDRGPEQADFLAAVVAGLARRQKTLPCQYFYDGEGSALFGRICALPEYYLTRTETALLRRCGPAIAGRLGPGCRVVEFGASAPDKAALLLDALKRPRAYVPVDIAKGPLLRCAAALAQRHPRLEVGALCADYTRPFWLPQAARGDGATVGFFPGSSIGNFTPARARRFLATARRVLGQGPMLVGVDLKKDPRRLEAAYNDRAGVTAAFNRNLLVRINRELGADFRPGAFRHWAFYNARRGRVEMHLRSLEAQSVRLDGREFSFRPAETIHTENSYKYAPEEFTALGRAAGFGRVDLWTDPQRLFGLFLLGG